MLPMCQAEWRLPHKGDRRTSYPVRIRPAGVVGRGRIKSIPLHPASPHGAAGGPQLPGNPGTPLPDRAEGIRADAHSRGVDADCRKELSIRHLRRKAMVHSMSHVTSRYRFPCRLRAAGERRKNGLRRNIRSRF